MTEEQEEEYRRLVAQLDTLKAEARMLIHRGRFQDALRVVDQALVAMRSSYFEVPGMLEIINASRQQCLTTMALMNVTEKARRGYRKAVAADAAAAAGRGR